MSHGATGSSEAFEADVLLTVFMEGTSNPIGQLTTQIGVFAAICDARDLPDRPPADFAPPVEPGHYKVAFDGCGVSHGLLGTVIAHGLTEQCGVVQTYVQGFVDANLRVKVNFLGLSRGGIGGLYLAQKLHASFKPFHVRLNLCLFDPVPGNVIWMARCVDFLGVVMNTNLAMDISSCDLLGYVLALYPHQPLPDIALHAPLIPTYPESAASRVEEEVLLGCHQGALSGRVSADSCLSFYRIRGFLEDHGTRLLLGGSAAQGGQPDRLACIALDAARRLDVGEEELLRLLNEDLRTQDVATTRSAHAALPGVQVVRHSNQKLLNPTHRRLFTKLVGEPDPQARYALEIVRGS